MSLDTLNAAQVPGRTKRHEDNGNAGAQDACDRRCSQRMHYPTITNAPNQEASTKFLPLQVQAQVQAQVPPKVPVAAAARSASKTDRQMRMGEFIDGKSASASRPSAAPSTTDLQSFAKVETEDTLDRRVFNLSSKEQLKHGSKIARHRTGKKKLPAQRTSMPGPRRRLSSDVIAASLPVCSRELSTPDMSRTEQQLLSSQSNYEILRSYNPILNNVSFPASLLASVDSKRTQKKREEKSRRDRMKHAMDALANVLPHKPSAYAAASRTGSKDTSRAETIEYAVEYVKELHKKYSIETNAEDKL